MDQQSPEDFFRQFGLGQPQQRQIKLTKEQCAMVVEVLKAVEGQNSQQADIILAVANAYIKHHTHQVVTMLGISDLYKADVEKENSDG